MKQRFVGFFIVYILVLLALLVVGNLVFSLELTSTYVATSAMQSWALAQIGMMLLPLKGIPGLGEPVAFKLPGGGAGVYYGMVSKYLFNGWLRWRVAVTVSHIEYFPESQLIGKDLSVTNKSSRADTADTRRLQFGNRVALAFILSLGVVMCLNMDISVLLLGCLYGLAFALALIIGRVFLSRMPAVGVLAKFYREGHVVLGRVTQLSDAYRSVELEILAVGTPNGRLRGDSLLQGRRIFLPLADRIS